MCLLCQLNMHALLLLECFALIAVGEGEAASTGSAEGPATAGETAACCGSKVGLALESTTSTCCCHCSLALPAVGTPAIAAVWLVTYRQLVHTRPRPANVQHWLGWQLRMLWLVYNCLQLPCKGASRCQPDQQALARGAAAAHAAGAAAVGAAA